MSSYIQWHYNRFRNAGGNHAEYVLAQDLDSDSAALLKENYERFVEAEPIVDLDGEKSVFISSLNRVYLATVTAVRDLDFGINNICPVAVSAMSDKDARIKIFEFLHKMFPDTNVFDWDVDGVRECRRSTSQEVSKILSYLSDSGFLIIL